MSSGGSACQRVSCSHKYVTAVIKPTSVGIVPRRLLIPISLEMTTQHPYIHQQHTSLCQVEGARVNGCRALTSTSSPSASQPLLVWFLSFLDHSTPCHHAQRHLPHHHVNPGVYQPTTQSPFPLRSVVSSVHLWRSLRVKAYPFKFKGVGGTRTGGYMWTGSPGRPGTRADPSMRSNRRCPGWCCRCHGCTTCQRCPR
jgi:hypothetical protein